MRVQILLLFASLANASQKRSADFGPGFGFQINIPSFGPNPNAGHNFGFNLDFSDGVGRIGTFTRSRDSSGTGLAHPFGIGNSYAGFDAGTDYNGYFGASGSGAQRNHFGHFRGGHLNNHIIGRRSLIL